MEVHYKILFMIDVLVDFRELNKSCHTTAVTMTIRGASRVPGMAPRAPRALMLTHEVGAARFSV